MSEASGSRFAATYHGANAEPVTLILAPHGLAIERSAGEGLWWPFEQVKVTRQRAHAILMHSSGTWVEVEDPSFLPMLEQLNRAVAQGRSYRPAAQFWWRFGTLVAVAIAAVAATFLWGIPIMSEWMADFVPASVEEQIGRATLDSMAPPGKTCHDPAIDSITERLSAAEDISDYDFRVVVVEEPVVNAFAAPGGYIAIYRGLLQRTRRPEEAAAVVAHEMEHVVQRHSLRGMMRGVSLWLSISLLTSSPGDAIGEMAGTLGSLHYQREDEASADAAGIALLRKAGIDPRAMISMLELLDEQRAHVPAAARYFSTHPLTEDRIEQARRLAGATEGSFTELLPGEPWPPGPVLCVKESPPQAR